MAGQQTASPMKGIDVKSGQSSTSSVSSKHNSRKRAARRRDEHSIKTADSGAGAKLNTFSNDGSFMARFQQGRSASPLASTNSIGSQTTAAVGASESAIDRKKAMEDRFRNRGKKRLAAASTMDEESKAAPDPSQGGLGEADAKRQRRKEGQDQETSTTEDDEYVREVRKLEQRSLKDKGAGVRALVK